MRYHVTLTTPEAVARQLNTVNPDGTAPEVVYEQGVAQYRNFWAFVTDLCHEASEYITNETGRSFVPFKADYSVVWADVVGEIRRGRLPLPDDLLVLSTLGFGDVVIGTSDYRVSPSNSTPIDALYLSNTAMTGAVYDFGAAFALSGIWGYVPNLSQAWRTIQSSITIASADTTILNVSLATANRYETLQYLRCENEYMQIVGINNKRDELTVLRGVNGTTAAIHTSKPLDSFNVTPDIRKAATELVAYMYQKRTNVGSVQFADGSALLDAFPRFVKDTINRYKPMAWRSTSRTW